MRNEPAYYAANKLRQRNRNLRSKFGITLERLEALRAAQDGRCAICHTTEPKGRGDFHVDHDHETKKVRGLLCQRCNVGLGHFGDNASLLDKAAKYLRESKKTVILNQPTGGSVVKITIEFEGVDQAIVALGKLVGAPTAKRGNPASAAAGDTTPTGASSPVPPAPVAPATTPSKPPRKGRSDAGQPRGPNARTAEPQPTLPPAATEAPVAIVLTTAAPSEKAPVEGDKPQPPGVTPAPSSAATTPTDADVQKTVEALFNKRGYDDCSAALSRFGVRRGKDLLPELRAEFIAKAQKMVDDPKEQA